MYKLKLCDNWEQKANEKPVHYISNKRNLSKSQIKEITKLIAQAQVIETGENYLVYQIDGMIK